jgi:hypothetical protein
MTLELEKAIKNILRSKQSKEVRDGGVVCDDIPVISSIIKREYGFTPHIIVREGKYYIQAYPTRKKTGCRGKIAVYVNGSEHRYPVEVVFNDKKYVLSNISFPVIRAYVSFLKKITGDTSKKSIYYFSTDVKLPYLCDAKKYTKSGSKIRNRAERGDIEMG